MWPMSATQERPSMRLQLLKSRFIFFFFSPKNWTSLLSRRRGGEVGTWGQTGCPAGWWQDQAGWEGPPRGHNRWSPGCRWPLPPWQGGRPQGHRPWSPEHLRRLQGFRWRLEHLRRLSLPEYPQPAALRRTSTQTREGRHLLSSSFKDLNSQQPRPSWSQDQPRLHWRPPWRTRQWSRWGQDRRCQRRPSLGRRVDLALFPRHHAWSSDQGQRQVQELRSNFQSQRWGNESQRQRLPPHHHRLIFPRANRTMRGTATRRSITPASPGSSTPCSGRTSRRRWSSPQSRERRKKKIRV